MSRGRTPEGEHPLSAAERQARYRARHQAHQPTPVIRFRRPADRRSRLQRWHDAVAVLVALQTEYAAWYDALPDSLCDTPTAAALEAIAEIDLGELVSIAPPRGYGRDGTPADRKIFARQMPKKIRQPSEQPNPPPRFWRGSGQII